MTTDLSDFLPYLLNRAAEVVSQEFQPVYKDSYGMLRTEWRVLFHLGQYERMTARQICDQAGLHKTKVSRAVAALEAKRFVVRTRLDSDRRSETLTLTRAGRAAFDTLSKAATRYDQRLEAALGAEDVATLKRIAKRLMDVPKA